MGETSIAWTDYTFNPWRGCTKVSPGCLNCYAEKMSARNHAVLGEWGPGGKRAIAAPSYWRLPAKWDREAKHDGVRRRVFCASLADVFEDRPELVAPRASLFAAIAATPNLDWLLLTKRPKHIARMLPTDRGTWNLWLGVSVEDQKTADARIPLLLDTPAAVRFVSYEPALGPVSFDRLDTGGLGRLDALRGYHFVDGRNEPISTPRLDWLIAGGESGPGRRPCEVEWFESVRRQCRAAGVPFFMKQDGGPRPGTQGRIPDDLWAVKEFPR